MPNIDIPVRELIAWPLDDYTYRPKTSHVAIAQAKAALATRQPYRAAAALLQHETDANQAAFAVQASRADLLDEMQGLDWSLGIVDLTKLLAFQRRLSFHPNHRLQLEAFGAPKPIACDTTQSGRSFTITTTDPNLHLRIVGQQPQLHTGSPFFEVAEYRGRWFLRDGYHRAYAMLRAGITQSAAVIIRARSLAELGATQPWFFSEDVLFSSHPPHVTDFLDDALNIEYTRPPLIKTLHVTIEESYKLASSQAAQGEPS
ncbi:hypothetical protein SAMN05421770_103172 [Granulicella rosea]|uniref:ParB-like nuclease domain-containing protein n=1 Tax=Granulicella rosea TaxID=474952 RepID=A0A239IPV9_9BACT|nr:hypothetical protein [Granulicella rosea]SNS94464.1 hypothetical protein SAMN05421770_103172 [Granulicella rosea]